MVTAISRRLLTTTGNACQCENEHVGVPQPTSVSLENMMGARLLAATLSSHKRSVWRNQAMVLQYQHHAGERRWQQYALPLSQQYRGTAVSGNKEGTRHSGVNPERRSGGDETSVYIIPTTGYQQPQSIARRCLDGKTTSKCTKSGGGHVCSFQLLVQCRLS